MYSTCIGLFPGRYRLVLRPQFQKDVHWGDKNNARTSSHCIRRCLDGTYKIDSSFAAQPLVASTSTIDPQTYGVGARNKVLMEEEAQWRSCLHNSGRIETGPLHAGSCRVSTEMSAIESEEVCIYYAMVHNIL